MKFECTGLQVSNMDANEALADPEGLSWQVMALFTTPLALTFSGRLYFLILGDVGFIEDKLQCLALMCRIMCTWLWDLNLVN